ncbi:MAG: hypothetical protein H6704_00575 [Myxococcales bacterium]|nr:hypothetical protein [Myxococcales bacterium]
MNEAYLATITDAFLAASGRGLMLSARDLELVRGWARAGVPADIVVQGIRDAFEPAPARRVRGLAYVVPAVDRAVKAWRARGVGAHTGASDVGAAALPALERLVAAVARAHRGAGSPAMAAALEITGRALEALAQRAAVDASVDVQDHLDALVDQLTEAAHAALPEAVRDRVDAQIALQVRREADLQGAAELDALRRAARWRWMRRHLGLPAFEVEAEAW